MSSERPIVVLVHGMGKHAPGQFQKQFVTAIDAALQNYRTFETSSIADFATVLEINYDTIFDRVREDMSHIATRLANSGIGAASLGDRHTRSELIASLVRLEEELGSDGFLMTHFLDVVLYTTLLGGKVRVEVARQLAHIIAGNTSRNIHLIAHSLGTAVLHDSLAMLFRDGADFRDEIPDLDPVTHRLSSIWLFANVSRLVYSVTGLADPYQSVVKPGPNGCTNYLANVRHRFDVFARFSCFDPENDGSWVPRQVFDRSYLPIEISNVRRLNTHDFADSLENPKVSVPLLRRLVRLSPTEAELRTVAQNYRRRDVPGAFKLMRDAFAGLRIRNHATLAEVASTVRHFRQVLRHAMGQSDAFA